jgi:hypothetical protein
MAAPQPCAAAAPPPGSRSLMRPQRASPPPPASPAGAFFDETYRDTLAYALALAGGERELAEHLGVSVRQLKNWLKGVEPIPDRIFHAALDVVIRASRQAIHRSRGMIERFAR